MHTSDVYVDDILYKSIKDHGDTMSPIYRIRMNVLEHVIGLDTLLTNIERARGTVSGKKFFIYIEGVSIVGY